LAEVFASKTLSIQNCIIGTFNAPEVNAGGVDYLLYPTAFSVEPMALLPGTEFWNLALADLGRLYKGRTGKTEYQEKSVWTYRMTPSVTVLSDESGTKMLVNSYSVGKPCACKRHG